MQQPGPMFPVMPSFPPTNITTEQIQKYLDENKKLILAILDNQNLGKLAECAQYQAQLQKNLMYLAAIADAQPQTQTMPPQVLPQTQAMPPQMQMAPHPAMQQGGFYMQQQPGGVMLTPAPPRTTPFSNSQHPVQQQDLMHLPHPQPTQCHVAMRPVGPNGGSGHTPQHSDPHVGGGNSVPASGSGNNKPDSNAAPITSDHRRGNNDVAVQGGGDGQDTK